MWPRAGLPSSNWSLQAAGVQWEQLLQSSLQLEALCIGISLGKLPAALWIIHVTQLITFNILTGETCIYDLGGRVTSPGQLYMQWRGPRHAACWGGGCSAQTGPRLETLETLDRARGDIAHLGSRHWLGCLARLAGTALWKPFHFCCTSTATCGHRLALAGRGREKSSDSWENYTREKCQPPH